MYMCIYPLEEMAIYICRSLELISRKNSSYLFKPHISSSFSLLFASSTPSQKRSSGGSVTVAEYLLDRHQFSPETASKVASVVKRLKNPENSDSILSYLKEIGFSKTNLECVIQNMPQILSSDLNYTIKPKFRVFIELGFSLGDVVQIISSDPWILGRSAVNRVAPSILALKSALGSNFDVSRVLKISGWFLKYDLGKTMIPNIEFLKSLGISSCQITKFVYNFPRFFLFRPERLKGFVQRVDELGFNRNSNMYINAIRVVSAMTLKKWESKLKLLRALGFTEDDILSAFRKKPHVFAVSERKIKKVTELLLSSGKLDISYLANHPELFIWSFEKRLRPRLQVLDILEKKSLPAKKPSLMTICRIPDKKFHKKFVLPYSDEVGHMKMFNKGL